jgi:PP-loop superfamily ATP-utilizing enzyme
VRERLVAAVKEAGYRFVALDLEGYRSGSLNPETPRLHRIAPARDGGQ